VEHTGTVAKDGRYLSYVAVPGWSFPAGIIGLMFVGGLGALGVSAVSGGPWLFALFFLAVCAYVAYGFLYRRAYLVRVENDVLSWHGFLYHGSRPTKDISAISRTGSGYVWTFDDGSSMTMMAWATLGRPSQAARFLDELASRYPDMAIWPTPASP
jgi:hypothetical protein